jgi:pyruvate ferredoxin oxidoreductase alpha subunit
MINKKIALSGGEAIAEALRQIEPDVFAMYPITPQTPIIEKYTKFEMQKKVKTKIVCAESEHSALSIAVGASAAGVRATTATASQGLLYMYEMLGVASGLRLPIVMPIANRSTSSPINIHCDHSDSMSALDQGWIQMYCENAQEAYETTIFLQKLAETTYLPAMICIDGFFTSHTVENVFLFDDKKVKGFVGKYKPMYDLLDTTNPITVGSLALPNHQFEIKAEIDLANNTVKKTFKDVAKDFKKTFNQKIEIYEDYFAKDSEVVIVVLSSSAGTVKEVVDNLRQKNISVGLLKPRLYRPFLYEEYRKAFKNAKKIIVLDRSFGYGSVPPLYKDIKICVSEFSRKIDIYSFVYGIGGRDFYYKDAEEIIMSVIKN